MLAELEGYVEHGVGQVVWEPAPGVLLPDARDSSDTGHDFEAPVFDALHHATTTSPTHPWSLGGGTGVVVVHTDIEHEYAAAAKMSFRLSESSGRYTS